MIKAEVEGIVKKVVYKGEKSCKFTITDGSNDLICTITKRNIELADHITEGDKYKFKGIISAYTKVSEKGEFIYNVFYVSEVESFEVLEV